jgi:[ribosomal protein S18]-alanine N-acetyltransferase
MNLEFAPMSQTDALAVAEWRYPDPYSFYDWTADDEDAALLLDPKRRKGRFFSVRDESGKLIGFFELRLEKDDVVIGLGLRPELTGRGLGGEFVAAGIAFAQRKFRPTRFRLSVATFNKRAIKVYERAGFATTRSFDHETNGGVYRFLEMTRPA